MVSWSRRGLLIGAAGLAAGGGYLATRRQSAPLGFSLTEEQLAAGRTLLRSVPVIDAHAHPGRTFLRGARGLPIKIRAYAALGTFEGRTVTDMRAGGLSAAWFAGVSDVNVLALSGERGLHQRRAFEEGEAWASYRTQIANLERLGDHGMVRTVTAPEQLALAAEDGVVGAMWSMEGADFLQGSVERLGEAHDDGVRSITLVHYRTNELGDTMTEVPVHAGLTPAGRAVVRGMNRLSMLVDLAHLAEAAAFDALEVSTAPVMISHTHVRGPGADHPRFISRDLARAICEAGGVVGAWPAGIGISDLEGFVSRILQLVDALGPDHVALGTDMDASYQPVLDTYRHLPHLTARLLQRGMVEEEVAKVLGGNVLRVWRAVCGTDHTRPSSGAQP